MPNSPEPRAPQRSPLSTISSRMPAMGRGCSDPSAGAIANDPSMGSGTAGFEPGLPGKPGLIAPRLATPGGTSASGESWPLARSAVGERDNQGSQGRNESRGREECTADSDEERAGCVDCVN